METIEYRDFIIKPDCATGMFMWVHKEYDGPEDRRIGFCCQSVQQCKREIDDYIFENATYEVQVKSGKVESFDWFTQAVMATVRSGGILLTPIDSI